MKIICLKLLGLTCVLFVSCSEGITSEEIVAKLECVGYCHSIYHRSCLQVPYHCGKCILSYHDFGGICKKIKQEMNDPRNPENDFNMPEDRKSEYHNDLKKAVVVNEGGGGGGGGYSGDGGFLGNSIRMQRVEDNHYWDIIIIAIMCSVSVLLVVAIVLSIVCVCRLRSKRLNKEMPYQTFYGTTLKDPANPAANGDRKLAYSAQMYHYQYQKQQMLANEKANGFDQKNPSGNSTDDDLVDDDDTVYECPGLANTEGEMEVTNPYFVDQENQATKQP